MKTAIISDVHQNLDKLQIILKAIKRLGIQNKVFLGDWFDCFDVRATHTETANFLRDLIETDPFSKFILGNHDVPYAFNPKIFPCPGFSYERRIDIGNYLQRKHWSEFKLYVKVGNFYCSHAGFSPKFVNPIFGLSDEYIQFQTQKALDDAFSGLKTSWLGWGPGRGGSEIVSGITWLDFNSEFEIIENFNQIVGHTIAWKVRHFWDETSQNYCMDTNLDHFLVVDDETNEVQIYSTHGISISTNDSRQVSSVKYEDRTSKSKCLFQAKEPTNTPKIIL